MSRSIIPDLKKNVVWFLTGSQDLYGPETLEQVAEQSKAVVAQLAASSDIPVTIEWKPVLKSSDAIRRAMLDGPDWPMTLNSGLRSANNLRAILLPGVISVATQMLPMEAQ